MVEWILLDTNNVSTLLHYLDDFITVGPPDTNQCAENLAPSIAVIAYLQPDKCIGPSHGQALCFTGADSVMVGSTLVYQARTGVPHWPFALCRQGCLARSYLSVLHDQSAPVFLQTQPSNPPKF